MERPENGTFIDDLPEKLYHNREHGFSSSNFKSILKTSLHHFKHEYDQPQTPPAGPMRIGSVLHNLVLRPGTFDTELVVAPVFNNRSNAGKEARAEFEDKHKAMQIVSEKEFDLGTAMADAVLEDEDCIALFDGSINERSMYAAPNGIPLRARADAYKPNHLLELKSAADGSPEGFSKQVGNLKYHISLVHYAVLLEECVPEVDVMPMDMDYTFIVVENFAPFSVSIYKPSQLMIEAAWHQWCQVLTKLGDALESSQWTSYVDNKDENIIDLKPWDIPEGMDD